jgi:hypothetical protein
VSHCGLAIYIEKYLKEKEGELWKLKYFTTMLSNGWLLAEAACSRKLAAVVARILMSGRLQVAMRPQPLAMV